jgi:sugar transferase EpsL
MKRLVDIFLASIFIALTIIPLLITGLMIAIFDGRPIFFLQKRAGEHGQIFSVCKFRTMNHSNEIDANRVTALGAFLRKFSIDEIPQLWNILTGDMSFVGPRPLLPEYLPLYSTEQARRHNIKPGLTGWAQINGRNAITWEEKFELDVWYVDNQTLLLDLIILIKTPLKVFSARNISATNDMTPEPFKGSPKK